MLNTILKYDYLDFEFEFEGVVARLKPEIEEWLEENNIKWKLVAGTTHRVTDTQIQFSNTQDLIFFRMRWD